MQRRETDSDCRLSKDARPMINGTASAKVDLRAVGSRFFGKKGQRTNGFATRKHSWRGARGTRDVF